MTRFNAIALAWKDIFSLARPIVPALTHLEHKGSMGRIGVIGGSVDYTGAPFYSGISALKFGADLSFVFCSHDAAMPIKSYSPELMVSPFYHDEVFQSSDTSLIESEVVRATEKIKSALDRIHALVIGPGLGRNENVLKVVKEVIEVAKKKNLHIILDADGLFLLSKHPFLLQGYPRCIISPNKMEFERLAESSLNSLREVEGVDPAILSSFEVELSSHDERLRTRALSVLLGGLAIFRKGERDMITFGEDVYVIEENGSPRRSGGQGDILSGCLAVAYYWAYKYPSNDLLDIAAHFPKRNPKEELESSVSLNTILEIFPDVPGNERRMLVKSVTTSGGTQRLDTDASFFPTSAYKDRFSSVLAGLLAGSIVKKASEVAFHRYGRSMTAPNVVESLGQTFQTYIDGNSSA